MTGARRTVRARWLVAVVSVLVVGVVATGCARPPAPGASTSGVPQSARVGVSTGAPYSFLSDADLDRETASLRQAGVGALRIDVDWSVVEPVRGQRQWAGLDRVVAVARKYAMAVTGVVAYTPAWASRAGTPPGSTHGAPASAAQYADFARAAAARYASRITTWEIWNEPNLSGFFQPRPDPTAYADLVRQGYAAIKSAQPGATVLAGALAPAVDAPDGSSVRPETFAAALYAAGAGGSFDAMSVHPYCYPAMPTDTSTGAWNTFQRLGLVHDVMVRNGDGGKKIWLTEFGAPTSLSTGGVSEQVQSSMLTSGMDYARTLPWVGPVFVYNSRDTGTNRFDPEQNFGLIRTDFTLKPAWYAVLARAQKDAFGR